jgi:hypothetical protein
MRYRARAAGAFDLLHLGRIEGLDSVYFGTVIASGPKVVQSTGSGTCSTENSSISS